VNKEKREKEKHMKTNRLLSIAVMTCLWAAFTVASEKEKNAKYFESQFEQWSKVIADLKQADTANVASQDIEVIRTWIGQAQALVANEKLERVEPLLQRIEAQAETIRTKIDRVAAEDAAKRAEEQAASAETQAKEATAAADSADAKMKELEAQGL
jgi:hypothetical protein